MGRRYSRKRRRRPNRRPPGSWRRSWSFQDNRLDWGVTRQRYFDFRSVIPLMFTMNAVHLNHHQLLAPHYHQTFDLNSQSIHQLSEPPLANSMIILVSPFAHLPNPEQANSTITPQSAITSTLSESYQYSVPLLSSNTRGIHFRMRRIITCHQNEIIHVSDHPS